MAEPELDSWPSRVGRVMVLVPGKSWSALAAVPEYVCHFSEAAAGAVRESAASEHWARLVEVPSNVARRVNLAVWRARGRGPGEASAAVAAQGSRLSGAGQESVSRLALMIGALLPVKPVVVAVPGLTRTEHGVLDRPVEEEEGLQAGAPSKTILSSVSEGVSSVVRAAGRWRGGEAHPDLEALQKDGEAQGSRPLQTGCELPQFVPYSAKTPWHSGPRAVLSELFPKYGNYCGPNWSSGRSGGSLSWDKSPIDHLDYCCYCHDIGYDSHDQRDLYKADLKLLQCLETISERERWDRKGSGPSVAGAYRVLCIIGLRSFLMPYRRELIRRIEGAESRELFALKHEQLQDSKHQ